MNNNALFVQSSNTHNIIINNNGVGILLTFLYTRVYILMSPEAPTTMIWYPWK